MTSTMKVAIYAGPADIRVEDYPMPEPPAAGELLGDSLCHAKDISGMPKILLHECFASVQAATGRIMQALGDLFLRVQMQNIGAAPFRIMQIVAHAQQEIVGRIDMALVGFA